MKPAEKRWCLISAIPPDLQTPRFSNIAMLPHTSGLWLFSSSTKSFLCSTTWETQVSAHSSALALKSPIIPSHRANWCVLSPLLGALGEPTVLEPIVCQSCVELQASGEQELRYFLLVHLATSTLETLNICMLSDEKMNDEWRNDSAWDPFH